MSLREAANVDLLGYIGKLGGITLTLNEVTYDTPVALTGDSTGKNTSIKLTMLQGAAYEGSATYKYDRIELANLVKLFAYPVAAGEQTTLYGFIDNFINLIGIRVTREDLEDQPVVTADDGTVSVLLKANPGSLRFTGEGQLRLRAAVQLRTAFLADTMLWT